MKLIVYYRQRAAEVRLLAAGMCGSQSRRTLLMLADQWESLAQQVEERGRAQELLDSRPAPVR